MIEWFKNLFKKDIEDEKLIKLKKKYKSGYPATFIPTNEEIKLGDVYRKDDNTGYEVVIISFDGSFIVDVNDISFKDPKQNRMGFN